MEERLGKTLSMASKLAKEHFDQTLRAAGSSFQTYLVLRHADFHPGVSQRELADCLGIEAPTLVRHIDRLVKEGLVRRVAHPHDRRVSQVELTEAGSQHLGRISHVADAMDADFRALFTRGELQTFTALLYRIQDHYKNEADVHHRAG
jgi:MarR family transcriptional regulator for hemolysin